MDVGMHMSKACVLQTGPHYTRLSDGTEWIETRRGEKKPCQELALNTYATRGAQRHSQSSIQLQSAACVMSSLGFVSPSSGFRWSRGHPWSNSQSHQRSSHMWDVGAEGDENLAAR